MSDQTYVWLQMTLSNQLEFAEDPLRSNFLIHEVSRSHSDTPQSIGLLCTSDQLVAETST